MQRTLTFLTENVKNSWWKISHMHLIMMLKIIAKVGEV
jgi:hypothetical protein